MSKTPTDGAEQDRLSDHEYDGIQEYENPLPRWWVALFWVTIVFSVGYFAYYELGPGPTVIAEYEADVRIAAEREATLQAAAGGATEETLRALQLDRAVMASARELFGARCAACHGPEGQGVIGPNLTDEYWLHGGKLTEILRLVADGVPDKGMVPWKGQLKPTELQAMAAYIGTLRGTHPKNPKPPQGTKVSSRDTAVATLPR